MSLGPPTAMNWLARNVLAEQELQFVKSVGEETGHIWLY